MISNIDLCKLVEKNKDIIIRLFKQSGYECMLAIGLRRFCVFRHSSL